MTREKVIFCTHGFPGTGGGGTFNLIKYLPRHGYDPIVITNNHKFTVMEEQLLREHFPDGLRLYRTPTLPKSPFRLFSKYLRLPRLASFLDKFVFFPDFHVLEVPGATRVAVRLIRDEGIDCIITSSPPESAHLVGLLAKKRTGCSWIAHFRDLWTTKTIVNRPATRIHAKYLRELERTIYSQADHLIANTQGNYEIYARDFNISAKRMTLISNGYDATEVPVLDGVIPSEVSSAFRIGYMGYFDKPGFPWKEILYAVDRLRAHVGNNAVEFHIAGHVGPGASAFIAEKGYNQFVRLHGVLSHPDAFRLMLQSDLLVVLHYETGYSKAIVPHKLYHYLGMKKPVLGIGDEDGEMATIIRGANSGMVVSQSHADGVFKALSNLYQAWKAGGLGTHTANEDFIRRYEIQTLTAKLAATIEVARGRHRDVEMSA